MDIPVTISMVCVTTWSDIAVSVEPETPAPEIGEAAGNARRHVPPGDAKVPDPERVRELISSRGRSATRSGSRASGARTGSGVRKG